jgi:hypothetical protein
VPHAGPIKVSVLAATGRAAGAMLAVRSVLGLSSAASGR